jgi:hypothetical protein
LFNGIIKRRSSTVCGSVRSTAAYSAAEEIRREENVEKLTEILLDTEMGKINCRLQFTNSQYTPG